MSICKEFFQLDGFRQFSMMKAISSLGDPQKDCSSSIYIVDSGGSLPNVFKVVIEHRTKSKQTDPLFFSQHISKESLNAIETNVGRFPTGGMSISAIEKYMFFDSDNTLHVTDKMPHPMPMPIIPDDILEALPQVIRNQQKIYPDHPVDLAGMLRMAAFIVTKNSATSLYPWEISIKK